MRTIRFLLIASILLALAFIYSCSSENDTDDNRVIPESVNKFVAKQASEIGNDRIKYSYSYGDYDFYYIYLGELKNIPIYYENAKYLGTFANEEYKFSTTTITTNAMKETVSQSKQTTISTIEQYTKSKTSGGKISAEINAKFPIKLLKIEGKIGGEASWSDYTYNSSTTGFQETTSITETTERVSSFTQEKTETFIWYYSKEKGDKAGWYRYTLFANSDIYLYVIKDATGVIHYEFREYAKANALGWKFDYSESLSFEKNDNSNFEFDVSMLDNLPKPQLSFDYIEVQTEEKILGKEFSIAGEYTYTFDKIIPATIEIYAIGAGGGGQGGFSSQTTGLSCGTGGGGGGGAAAYMKFEATGPISLDIKVGKGGIGGDGVHRNITQGWQTGLNGKDGNDTKVIWNHKTLTAYGGKGGGEGRDNDARTFKGGSGGNWSLNNYDNILESTGKLGDKGGDGQDDIFKENSRGGDAGRLNIGTLGFFKGESGGFISKLNMTGNCNNYSYTVGNAGIGAGGAGAYNSVHTGHNGGDGKVVIVVKYLE